MRKLMATLSVLTMLSGGVVATIAEATAPATPGALYCAQPFDPTLRYVVNTVCSKFGP